MTIPWILVLPASQDPQRDRVQSHLETLAKAAKARVISVEPLDRAGAEAWLTWEPDLPSARGQELIADLVMSAISPELLEESDSRSR